MSVEAIVADWKARGSVFTAAGVASFSWQEGEGDPVVCLHGVPSCAFLYRKVLPELASRGLKGITFDLPGLGLAERPTDFDYSWSGLSAWSEAAVDELGLERFHLVVHDIGGPIGFDLGRRIPDRIISLTALNTLAYPATFRRPIVMQPFAMRIIGPIYLATTPPFVFERLMRFEGVSGPVPGEELRAYLYMLKRGDGASGDGGKMYLRIMRSFSLTEEFERGIVDHLKARSYPAQVLWGEDDPALTIRKRGEEVRELLGVETVHPLAGKHFVQEDAPSEIAERVAQLAASTSARAPEAPRARGKARTKSASR